MKKISENSDGVLVEMTLLGNGEAYGELVERHQRKVMGTAMKISGNKYSAEDASQDAFVSAWMHLDSLRDREKFGQWVCAIAKNCAKDLVYRYQNACADISLELLGNTLADETDDTSEIHEAVEELPEKYRNILSLHYFEGYSVDEIAEKLSLPAGTVKWRLSEGRKMIRKGFGMDNEYRENETLRSRVLREVEKLKLWRMRNDKTGFEKEYEKVLKMVDTLDEGEDRDRAKSDVMICGYWWIPGKKNDEVIKEIKELAEKSKNDDVMQEVMQAERDKYFRRAGVDEGLINLEREEHIPYLEKLGLRKTLGYCRFWLGWALLQLQREDEADEEFRKVTEILEPCHAYYTLAKYSLRMSEEKRRIEKENKYPHSLLFAAAPVVKKLKNRYCLWENPQADLWQNAGKIKLPVFISSFASKTDGILYDSTLKTGESITSSDGGYCLTLSADNTAVDTPSGRYENCKMYRVTGNGADGVTEMYFSPSAGLVRIKNTEHSESEEWVLSEYSINGGLLSRGNLWKYSYASDSGLIEAVDYTVEVVYSDRDTTIFGENIFRRVEGFDDSTWKGNICHVAWGYWTETDGIRLVDVRENARRAVKMAKTVREKRMSNIMSDVAQRIMAGDERITPDGTERGRWNFFQTFIPSKEGGKTVIRNFWKYDFEWKDTGEMSREGNKILYNFLYDILYGAAGCLWSEEWVPGYRDEKKGMVAYGTEPASTNLSVAEDEEVETPAGKFAACRHIVLDVSGYGGGWEYRGGHMEYWFAPGVGIVKFSRPINAEDGSQIENIWHLTDYSVTGEGYFPMGDGMTRRYEPKSIGDGFSAFVEYTFDGENGDMVLFRNAAGMEKRKKSKG
ncbi:MAG: sigma-70 family RNA polymerase sigma factor [Clostridia bacterium]|nr:sigma-70 family RNA polymerase sigma factor [Clostridia bacterium]